MNIEYLQKLKVAAQNANNEWPSNQALREYHAVATPEAILGLLNMIMAAENQDPSGEALVDAIEAAHETADKLARMCARDAVYR